MGTNDDVQEVREALAGWKWMLHRDDWTNPAAEYGPQLPELGSGHLPTLIRRRLLG